MASPVSRENSAVSVSSCLVVGNWKMHGTLTEAAALVDTLAGRAVAGGPVALRHAEIVLCPPHPLLVPVGQRIQETPFRLGGQDCSSAVPGPHTGEVAAAMLRDAGCRYVLLGHSERRTHQHESDAAVRAKVVAAQATGLTAIVCVGESAAVRQGGQAARYVTDQVLASLPAAVDAEATVVAYEPVWSIGTGDTPSVADIEAMHAALRDALLRTHGPGPWRVLYGGSVRARNAGAIAAGDGVDGLLVGGASLQPGEFWGICEAVSLTRTVPP